MKIKKEKRIFHCSNTGGLSKRNVNLRNLIIRLITTLFKVFGLHVEHVTDEKLSLCNLILKKKDQDCLQYQPIMTQMVLFLFNNWDF